MTKQKILSLHIPLSAEDILHLLRDSLYSDNPPAFKFPVAFSMDLYQIAVLRSVIRISVADKAHLPYECAYHIQPISPPHPSSISLSGEHFAQTADAQYSRISQYEIVFSPDGKYLLLSETQDLETGYNVIWGLTVFKDTQPGSNIPKFKVLTKKQFVCDRLGRRGFAVHPSLPILVMSPLSRTVIWNYTEKGKCRLWR
jgi:hypothetical protein